MKTGNVRYSSDGVTYRTKRLTAGTTWRPPKPATHIDFKYTTAWLYALCDETH